MLKPEQIANAQFTLIGKGAYRAEEVDAFLKNTAESYQEVVKQNEELMRKISILAERIEQYREEEDSIKSALINAERMAKTIRKEAEDEKAETMKDAQVEASAVIESARQNAKDFLAKTKATIAAYVDKANTEAAAIVDAANATAEETVAAANEKAVAVIGDSERRLAYNMKKSQALQAQIATFKAAMEAACTDGLAMLADLPEDADFDLDETAFYAAPVEEPVIAPVEEPAAAPAEEPVAAPDLVVEEPVAAPEVAVEEPAAEAPVEETIKEIVDDASDEEIFENILAEVNTERTAENAGETPVAVPAEEEEELFVDLYSDETPAADNGDAFDSMTFTPAAPEENDDGAEEAFDGFKINLDEIEDADSDDGDQSIFSGFFD